MTVKETKMKRERGTNSGNSSTGDDVFEGLGHRSEITSAGSSVECFRCEVLVMKR